jgi:2-methylcitrate dehydratase PrpD
MGYTRRLAGFLSTVSMGDLPAGVVHKARQCMLDFTASVYGSLELDAVNRAASFVRSLGGSPAATVLGFGFKTDVQSAAFMNGTLAEAIEAQDGLRFGGNHAGVAVIPAALAVAEHGRKSGSELIEAVVAGYEAANRISASVHPHHTLSGFLPTGTCGTFGAAAAAARLAGSDRELMLRALGNAGYLAPLSMAEQLMEGRTVKIVQGGQAASAGIMAAGLAGAGITGMPAVLEGAAYQGGFTQITTAKTGSKPDLERITRGLGEEFSIMDVYFKPYPACRHTHGTAQAMLELVREHGITARDVREIDVYTYGIAQIAVGKGIDNERSIVSAQFSIPYVTAVCLCDGEFGPGQLTEKRLEDPEVVALSGRVRVHLDEALNARYPNLTASRVELELENGGRLSRQIDIPAGDPRDPMTDDDLALKVRKFAEHSGKEDLDTVIAMILHLEDLKDIRELTRIM